MKVLKIKSCYNEEPLYIPLNALEILQAGKMHGVIVGNLNLTIEDKDSSCLETVLSQKN